MKFLSTVLLALTASAGTLAQQTNSTMGGTNSTMGGTNTTMEGGNATSFADGLLAALRQNNLTQLAAAVEGNADALLPVLASRGNKTVLAPSDAAFMALGDVDNSTLVATIAYHVLNGTYRIDDVSAERHTLAASMLNMSEYVQLPRNRSQVVVLGKYGQNNTAYVSQAARNVSFVAAANGPAYQSILVQPISEVLTIPGNTSEVAGQLGATQLTQLLQQANLVEPLDESTVTVFAPTNEAIMAVMQTISMATTEQQRAVLLNHVINGTVVYSTALADTPEAVSASGNNLTFMSNSTGAYVRSANTTARIVRSDRVASNGVIHVIDQVLVNTESNPTAAESAFNSASSAQATQTSVPGVGSAGNEDAGGKGGNGNENGAVSAAKVGGAAALAMLASGMWLLA